MYVDANISDAHLICIINFKFIKMGRGLPYFKEINIFDQLCLKTDLSSSAEDLLNIKKKITSFMKRIKRKFLMIIQKDSPSIREV